ncbi:MAG: NTP transferase domain-containing protein [Verrucomicrobia bacterium]|nr:NTP transferase domain-containing protein [Verrucomicrobiota bacterium]
MQVVILCGGLGTRLREETEYRPKPMVPVGNRPILWHIMKHYASYGHKEFILCLGYKGEVIKDYFRNYHWNTSDVTLRLSANSEPLYHNTRVLKFIRDDDFFLTYGDGLCNVNLHELVACHRAKAASVTLTAVRPGGRFGELAIEDGLVHSFLEKPKDGHASINGGFFVMNKSIAPLLDGDNCVLERAPLENLAQHGHLAAFPHDGFWQCMDNIREMELLNNLWSSGNAPWKTW